MLKTVKKNMGHDDDKKLALIQRHPVAHLNTSHAPPLVETLVRNYMFKVLAFILSTRAHTHLHLHLAFACEFPRQAHDRK